MSRLVKNKSPRMFPMNYTYRIEYVENFDVKIFIENDHHRDLLAVREDRLANFEKLFYLSEQEKMSLNRIRKWLKENHPELLL